MGLQKQLHLFMNDLKLFNDHKGLVDEFAVIADPDKIPAGR